MVQLVDVSEKTVLSLTGHDCLDFLQRISTNNVLSIGPGESMQTVLTNEKGRIVDVVTVVKRADGGMLLLGESQERGLLQAWIEKYIIMEDIRTEDVTDKHIRYIIYQPESALDGLHLENMPAGFLVVPEVWKDCRTFRVVVAAALKVAADSEFSRRGYQRSSFESYDEFRIRRGIPAAPNELSVSYNPLEAGLGDLINWTKGCYIGQEVIARLDTYKKVQKTLVKLQMEELPKALPAAILTADAECGTITSARRISGTGEPVGLGYLKTSIDLAGKKFFFVADDRKISVSVDH